MTDPIRQRSLSVYEGWVDYAQRQPRQRPGRLTRSELLQLAPADREAYSLRRRVWHANLLLRTRQVEHIHTHLQDLLESNLQDSDRVKSAAAIDAPPTLGKSTVVNTFARQFHRDRVGAAGDRVAGTDALHLPVCHVTLTGRMTIKGLHQMILGFYAHPAAHPVLPRSAAGRDLARAAADCIERHDTRLVVVDDLHFLNLRTRDGVEVANQFKWLANEYAATFLFAGVALRDSGLVGEGRSGRDAAMAQTFRRWTVFDLQPFTIRSRAGRDEWQRMLTALEQALILTEGGDGMLTGMSAYLFARTGGNIGSVMDLVRRGAARAIRTGAELLTTELLDQIRIDEGAERDRGAWESTDRKQPRQRRRSP